MSFPRSIVFQSNQSKTLIRNMTYNTCNRIYVSKKIHFITPHNRKNETVTGPSIQQWYLTVQLYFNIALDVHVHAIRNFAHSKHCSAIHACKIVSQLTNQLNSQLNPIMRITKYNVVNENILIKAFHSTSVHRQNYHAQQSIVCHCRLEMTLNEFQTAK